LQCDCLFLLERIQLFSRQIKILEEGILSNVKDEMEFQFLQQASGRSSLLRFFLKQETYRDSLPTDTFVLTQGLSQGLLNPVDLQREEGDQSKETPISSVNLSTGPYMECRRSLSY
jgi:hypothetical protein